MNRYTIGDRIRAARIAAGLSQGDLSKRTGEAQPAISRIERGETENPGFYIVAKLASELGVSLDELANGAIPTRARRIALESRVRMLEAIVQKLEDSAR